MNIDINLAKHTNELEDAFHVRHVVFIEEQGVPADLERDAADASATHFIVKNEDEPIGAARIRLLDAETAKVERVAVLASHRGQGIGEKLMRYIEQHAKEKGLFTLKLNAQKHAEPFYLRLGYVSVGPPFEEAGIEHVAMKKNLSLPRG